MIDLRGKKALVTGAGRRVGAAVARALGAQGMSVAVHYNAAQNGAEETCEAIRAAGGAALAIQGDSSRSDAARQLTDRAIRELGGLNLLVASAANFERMAFDDVDDAAWDRAIGLNLTAPFAMAHQARGALKQARGSIIFITCASATMPYRRYLPYVVSKGALRHLMRTLALELAPDVRVNAVAPGTVLPPDSMDEAAVARLAKRIPLDRIGEPEDVAEAAVYLARAPFVTGHEIMIDGGRTVGAAPEGGDGFAGGGGS